ncbi:RNA-directed DNA polymerase, eukaryota, reverse transcriptase zinc-binding domain protein [Tanacetum coccineum]
MDDYCDNSSCEEIRAGNEILRENKEDDDAENTGIEVENNINKEQSMDTERIGNDEVVENKGEKLHDVIQESVNKGYKNGSLKWNLTVCGHFVGVKMPYNEENSPWMVDGRPLIVQKWNPKVSLDKPEPDKIPLWVKMFDIPLKAWNHKGISKLASSIGKPLIMDAMTASMCQFGRGRLRYARVLIEVDTKKQFKQGIDVQYRDREGNVVRTKQIRIEYSWRPPICEFCHVFGHTTKICNKRPMTGEEVEQRKQNKECTEISKEGFTDVKKRQTHQNNFNNRVMQNNFGRGKRTGYNEGSKDHNVPKGKYEYRPKGNDNNLHKEQQADMNVIETLKITKKPAKGSSNGHTGTQTKNKFSVLEDCDDEGHKWKLNKEEYFFHQRLQPTPFETGKWTHEMNIRGMGTLDKQDELQKLVLENKLSILAVLKTRAKGKENCLGWNANVVKVDVLYCSWQVVFCIVETVQRTSKFFLNNNSWVLLGDFNVTLCVHEHSMGGSTINQDMQDFKDCVAINELDDLCSTGLQYTWTKSPKNPMCDRPEFISSVAKDWKMNVMGFQMFKVVKAMKNIKKPMNELNWKNGNLFKKVILLKDKLKEWQAKIDSDLFNSEFKKEALVILNEYREAVVDENKLLSQKAKVNWMKDGDKNTAFFHKVIKGRKQKSKIDSICDENGKRFYGEEVPDHIEEANEMVEQITDAEIKKAMFDIDNEKALGPDGFTSYFFKNPGLFVMEPLKGEILKIIPFSVGKLPMKYLGVPLLAKCLVIKDCKQLVEKVKERIGYWKNRFLSYAGRVQLISFVLASLQIYWASVYLIPKTMVNEIDKEMKAFLWSHGGGSPTTVQVEIREKSRAILSNISLCSPSAPRISCTSSFTLANL